MDAEHAALVIARLRANWPNTDLTETMTDVWLDALRDVKFDDGAKAADVCIAELDRFTFPQVAQFRERWRTIVRRQHEAETTQRQLDVPPATEEQRAANLAALRRAREIVRSTPTRALARLALEVDEAEPRPIALPPPCDHDDHRYCKAGPIRPLKSDPQPADNQPGAPAPPTKEKPPA